MALDINRVAAAAIEATLNGEQSHRRRGSTTRALVSAAVLVTAARAGKERLPAGATRRLMKAGARKLGPNIREAANSVRHRFAKPDDAEAEEPLEDEDEEGLGEEGFEDEEPEDEESAEADPEDEEEADSEGELDGEDEEEADSGDDHSSGGRRTRQLTADLMELLSEVAAQPPVAGRRTRRIDPAARPPARPRRRTADEEEDGQRDRAGSRARQKKPSA